MIAGVDEAGRGPVIGPLVVAAVLVDEEQEEKLRSLGVRDSKKVSPNRREELANMIKRVVTSYSVVVVEPAEIDQAVRRKNLNRLEAEKFAEAINNLSSMPDRVIVDSADNNPER
ncbi:MAG: ribonuclease HII, partial [Methanobacteriota archaeon]